MRGAPKAIILSLLGLGLNGNHTQPQVTCRITVCVPIKMKIKQPERNKIYVQSD